MGGILDNAGLQAVGAADPYGQWQGYGLRNQEALLNEQKLKQNEMALADAQRLRERKQRLIPFRALTTDMPGTTDSDGTPLPNLEPIQGQFLLEALKNAKNAKGEPVIQDRGGEPYISEEDYEWGLGIIEKNAGIQTKLAELKSVAIKQKIDTANEEVLKILKKDPNADKPKIVDPQTGLEVDNPAFAEYKKAVANRDNQINYMNMVNKAAKGTLDEAKQTEQPLTAEQSQTLYGTDAYVGILQSQVEKAGIKAPGSGGSGSQTELEQWKAENPGKTVAEYWVDKNNKTNKTNFQFAGLSADDSSMAITFDPNTGKYSTVKLPASGIRKKTLDSLGAEKASEIGVSNSVIEGIERVQDKLKKDPSLMAKVGAIEGRWTKVKRLFAEDPQAEGLNREIESMIRIAYGWSGKQISDAELEKLQRAVLPQLSNPDANFIVSLNHAKTIMETDRNSKLQAYKDANIDIGKLDKYLKESNQTSSGNRFTVKETKK